MSDSEFETTSPYTPNSCLKRRHLRSLPPGNKTTVLFAPGGILDSQTSNTQWEENLLDSDSYLDISISQEPEPFGAGSDCSPSTSAPAVSTLHLALCPSPSPSVSLAEKVFSVVEHHAKEVEEDVRRQVEGRVRTEVAALRAQVDLLCGELHCERQWIRALEEFLKENSITFPSYPCND